MRMSFIVTSFDIAPYLGECLDSLSACLSPGDEVIVVDDGSGDGTAELVEAALADDSRFPEGVTRQPILIGTNTSGGVGIPANIGLRAATGAAVFFVDGDDWMEPEGFRAARAVFEGSGADILIGNYLEHDQAAGTARRPADARRWADLPPASDAAGRRMRALSMIAVPWRKFYRVDFLRAHDLRFPEGTVFYEDNPFHWAVCLAARTIAFEDRVLCRHRINRPGQTMAATGSELAAFFDHYKTIRGGLPAEDAVLQGAALDWLLNNMSWQIGRLQTGSWWSYAGRAAEALALPSDAVWSAAMHRFRQTEIGGIAAALRHGGPAGVVGVWTTQRAQRKLEAIENAIRRLQADVTRYGGQVDRTRSGLDGLRAIAEFDALLGLAADLPAAPPRSE